MWFRADSHVKLYALKQIEISGASGGLSWDSDLVGSEGNEAGVGLRDVQRNSALWDLVYNGIVYSVRHNRAVPNKKAMQDFNCIELAFEQ